MDPVRGGVIAAISDVGCIPAVAGRAYTRIFNWRRDCLRKGRKGGIKEVQKCKSGNVRMWFQSKRGGLSGLSVRNSGSRKGREGREER